MKESAVSAIDILYSEIKRRGNGYSDQFLTSKERSARRAQGPDYFCPGKLYKARKSFTGLCKRKEGKYKRGKIAINAGDILLCIDCEKFDDGTFAVIQFIYGEEMLWYKTTGTPLCYLLDLVEFKENE